MSESKNKQLLRDAFDSPAMSFEPGTFGEIMLGIFDIANPPVEPDIPAKKSVSEYFQEIGRQLEAMGPEQRDVLRARLEGEHVTPVEDFVAVRLYDGKEEAKLNAEIVRLKARVISLQNSSSERTCRECDAAPAWQNCASCGVMLCNSCGWYAGGVGEQCCSCYGAPCTSCLPRSIRMAKIDSDANRRRLTEHVR